MCERGVLGHADLGGCMFGSLGHWRMLKVLCFQSSKQVAFGDVPEHI